MGDGGLGSCIDVLTATQAMKEYIGCGWVLEGKEGLNWVGGKGGEGGASVKLGVVLTCLLAIGFFLSLTRRLRR